MRDLTKWPRLIVVPEKPEPLTREQANEILIRTADPVMWVNDRAWVREVAAVFGVPVASYGGMEWKPFAEWFASAGGLDLHYIVNSRIMSAWIGGPHGWCDWDGRIGCSTWNIGKWPSYEDVSEDWQAIAAAFPYLDLHAQLITDEGEGEVAGQWRVAGGQAAMVEPAGRFEPQELGAAGIMFRFAFEGGERGVSLERLREAVEQVQAARE